MGQMSKAQIGCHYDYMESLDGNNWGVILNKPKKLDRSDNDPYFTEEEYQQLDAIREQRNYWCHQCYLDYVYISNDFDRNALFSNYGLLRTTKTWW